MKIEVVDCKSMESFLLSLKKQDIRLVKVWGYVEPMPWTIRKGMATATKSGLNVIFRFNSQVPEGVLTNRIMLEGYNVSEGEWTPEGVEALESIK